MLKNHLFIVPEESHGQRLDQALAKLLPEYSRSLISQWIKEGLATLDGKECKPKEKVKAGSAITLDLSEEKPLYLLPSKPQAIPLNIVYEDESILVINKSAGLVVHPGAGNPENTLVNGLLYYCPDLEQLPRAGIIHRLDKDTTGLLIIAKSLIAHTQLIRQMQAREIEKQYLALVQGHLIASGVIETGISRHSRNRLKMAVSPQGKPAVTEYCIKKHYGDFTLLKVNLLTGRTHQIRVHLAHIHHPIVGDQLYGGRMKFPAHADSSLRDHLQKFKRQALHACSLTFLHPLTQQHLVLSAPLPDDFQTLLHVLDTHYEKS